MYLRQYQFNAVKGNLAYPGLITISGKRESSKLRHVIGLIGGIVYANVMLAMYVSILLTRRRTYLTYIQAECQAVT